MNEQKNGMTPSASGILQCLRALAQEAAALNLLHTLSAIEDALEAAARESGMDVTDDVYDGEPERPVLH
jgi:hypothetical protein